MWIFNCLGGWSTLNLCIAQVSTVLCLKFSIVKIKSLFFRDPNTTQETFWDLLDYMPKYMPSTMGRHNKTINKYLSLGTSSLHRFRISMATSTLFSRESGLPGFPRRPVCCTTSCSHTVWLRGTSTCSNINSWWVDSWVLFPGAVSLTSCHQGHVENNDFSFTDEEDSALHHHWGQQLHVLSTGRPWGHEYYSLANSGTSLSMNLQED